MEITTQQLIASALLPTGANPSKNEVDSYWLPNDELDSLSLPALDEHWHRPNFIIVHDASGCPSKVKVSLQRGSKSKRVVVEGPDCDNFSDALITAYTKAQRIQPEDLNVFELRALFIESLSPDRCKLKFHGPLFNDSVKEGVSHFIASILCKGNVYYSTPHHKKSEAISELASILNAVTDLSTLIKIPKPPTPKQPKKPKHQEDNNTGAQPLPQNRLDLGFLKSLTQRWRREHALLLKKQIRSMHDEERFIDLSRFLIVSDPLRWFEISLQVRAATIQKLQPEIDDQLFRQTEKGQLNLLASYLTAMAIGHTLSPGDPVDIGEKWKTKALRKGDDPQEIIERLVHLKLLRDSGMGSRYSLSNRAISLIHSHHKNEFKQGTIGSTIPAEIIFELLQHTTADH